MDSCYRWNRGIPYDGHFCRAGRSRLPHTRHGLRYSFWPWRGTDLTVRLFKDHVEKLLGQPMVMIYKPGAAGVIAGAYVKESKPDGYTFFVISNTSLVSSMVTRKADFTLDDFTPICTLTLSPIIFAVKKDSPYKT